MPQNEYYKVHAFNEPYVYYQSLLDQEPHSYKNKYGVYQQSDKAHNLMNLTGKIANTYLTARELFENRSGHTSGMIRVNNALDFLKKAADGQLAAEKSFLKAALEDTDNEEIKELLKSFGTDSFSYMKFMAHLNYYIKGYKEAKEQLKNEIERIEEYGNRIKIFEKRMEKFMINKKREPNNKERGYLLAKSGLTRDSGPNVVYTRQGIINADKTAEMIIKALDTTYTNNHAIKLVETIVGRYGSRIFDFKGTQFQLNSQRSIILIKIITTEMWRMLMGKIGNMKINKISDDLEKELPKPIKITNVSLNDKEWLKMDKIVDNIFETWDPEALDSFATKYGFGPEKRNTHSIRAEDSKIKRLERMLRISYDNYKKGLNKPLTYAAWKQQQGFTDLTLKEIVSSIDMLHIETSFQSESDTAQELANAISNTGARIVGQKGAATDIYAGTLFVKINTDDKILKQQLQQKIQETTRQMTKIEQKAYKQVKATGYTEDWLKNSKILTKATEEQKKIIKKLMSSLTEEEKAAVKLKGLFNIQTSTKDYSTISTKTSQFTGASLGANLEQQLTRITELAKSGGVAMPEIKWLKIAIINTARGLIGTTIKPSLEEYLSLFVGFCMFDDVQQELAVDINNIINDQTSVNSIHLYYLNGIYVPQSFILQELYKSITNSLKENGALGKSNQKWMNAKITSSYEVKNNFFTGVLDPSQWDKEAQSAIQSTNIIIHFMGNFNTFLTNLNAAMNLKF